MLASQAAQAQQAIWGLGRAKDGDSLMVGETEVRLFGVDAPEFDQTCTRAGQSWACGAVAADQLMQLVTGKDVQCTSMGKDEHQRVLGRCTVNGVDVNQTMVARGYAVAYRRYSSDYAATEDSAKTAKLGVSCCFAEFLQRLEYERTSLRQLEAAQLGHGARQVGRGGA